MIETLVSPSDIHEAATDFRRASKDMQKLASNLDSTMERLQGKWQGSSQQLFYRDYKLWQQQSLGLAQMLANISKELEAMAERFAAADQ
ncbi:MAG: hypothetical protein BroJett039_06940 [Chloroflexota bacterium]|nr:MAG: hypothetical protein BroJett039_06940 [Chloroflexota bacterium]